VLAVVALVCTLRATKPVSTFDFRRG